MKNRIIMAAGIFALVTGTAHADKNFGRVKNETYKAECGACHLPFQPGFLSAGSWTAIMGDLSNHFGEDATLDEETRAALTNYLVDNAGRKRKTKNGQPVLRITELRWFVKEHNHEVSSRAKKRAGTMANCAACHRGAENGYFDDD